MRCFKLSTINNRINSSNVNINGFGINVSSVNTSSVFINGKSLDSFLNPISLPNDDENLVDEK